MLKKIKNYAVALAMIFSLATPVMIPAFASATTDLKTEVCKGTNLALSSTSSSCQTNGSDTNLSALAAKVVNLLSIIVGVVAVIMIIIGGLRYITSGGESGSVSGAKNTLIYAIIGLVIVALAQFIVHFVLNNVTTK